MAAPRNSNIKEKILDTTAMLLQGNAFDTITLARIAQSAEISKGTLYYYYSNKEDILFDIADRYLHALATQLADWVDNKEKDTSLPRLIKYILERGTAKEFGNLRLYLIGEGVSGHAALRSRYVERYAQFHATLSQKIAERAPKADAPYLTWLLLTVMDGILVQQQLENPAFETAQFIADTTQLVDFLSRPSSRQKESLQ